MASAPTTLVTAISLFIAIAYADDVIQPQPIPALDVFRWMGSDALQATTVDMFIDFQCSDSKTAWPIIKQVVAHFSQLGKELRVNVWNMPLPYHFQAFLAAQSGQVVVNVTGNASSYLEFADACFAHQNEFLNGPTEKMNRTEIVHIFADLAYKCCEIDPLTFLGAFYSADSNANEMARIEWKRSAALGIHGTPQYMVNGVHVPLADESWTVDNWVELLDPIVK